MQSRGGRDYNTAEIPERLLRQVYLPPFEAAARAGAPTFMSAFEALNEVPSTENGFTLKTVLRDEWDYRGLVVSDYGAVAVNSTRRAWHWTELRRPAELRSPVVDMDMESNLYPHGAAWRWCAPARCRRPVLDEAGASHSAGKVRSRTLR